MMTLRPTSILNNLLLSKTPLQTVFLNVRQKQSLIHRRKACNQYKIVIDFSLSINGSILANSYFKSIGFASNENNQEDSIPRIIYKSNSQTLENRNNTEHILLKKSL